MSKLETPSVDAFEAKIVPSDGLMYGVKWIDRHNASNFKPIEVHEKSVRGTISNRQPVKISSDDTKLNAEVSKPNLQKVDTASLDFDVDTLALTFTLRLLGDLDRPSTCNSPAYEVALASIVQGFREEISFSELANRYAVNIANGRFLWRNRVGAEALEVVVESGQDRWVFDAAAIPTRSFSKPAGDLNALARLIESAISAKSHAFLRITAYSLLGQGQTVYPSQELVMSDSAEKSKFLYQLGGVAAMHSQKIGNALRTIDTWHIAAEEIGPIAIEPFGSVTNRGVAYRQPRRKDDFYSILDAWILKSQKPAIEQQNYVMAMLIRGGVFGEKSS